MKLLFDQNLSPSLVQRLTELYPQSNHLYLMGLDREDNYQAILAFSQDNSMGIIALS